MCLSNAPENMTKEPYRDLPFRECMTYTHKRPTKETHKRDVQKRRAKETYRDWPFRECMTYISSKIQKKLFFSSKRNVFGMGLIEWVMTLFRFD